MTVIANKKLGYDEWCEVHDYIRDRYGICGFEFVGSKSLFDLVFEYAVHNIDTTITTKYGLMDVFHEGMIHYLTREDAKFFLIFNKGELQSEGAD
ncbi:MAG: hypothetical protein J6T77_02665 [Clostridia bacterium]|nr:hypothetical protein [Clostridia bacterium]